MSDDQSSVVTLKVRVTPEFREKITSAAKSNNRSMNAEIVHRLEQTFFAEENAGSQDLKLNYMNLRYFGHTLDSEPCIKFHDKSENLKDYELFTKIIYESLDKLGYHLTKDEVNKTEDLVEDDKKAP